MANERNPSKPAIDRVQFIPDGSVKLWSSEITPIKIKNRSRSYIAVRASVNVERSRDCKIILGGADSRFVLCPLGMVKVEAFYKPKVGTLAFDEQRDYIKFRLAEVSSSTDAKTFWSHVPRDTTVREVIIHLLDPNKKEPNDPVSVSNSDSSIIQPPEKVKAKAQIAKQALIEAAAKPKITTKGKATRPKKPSPAKPKAKCVMKHIGDTSTSSSSGSGSESDNSSESDSTSDS